MGTGGGGTGLTSGIEGGKGITPGSGGNGNGNLGNGGNGNIEGSGGKGNGNAKGGAPGNEKLQSGLLIFSISPLSFPSVALSPPETSDFS